MRKRLEGQGSLFFYDIGSAKIPTKSRSATVKLFACLKAIYLDDEYLEKILTILEKSIPFKKQTGREGLNLWQIFVLAQLRMCENISYDRLEYLAMHDILLRHILGIRDNGTQEEICWEYQRIYDNVNILDDSMLSDINTMVVEFGQGNVFKKKGTVGLNLKTDSYVMESNVHFPTDYNLLWDCSRKCLSEIGSMLKKYPEIGGWRKLENWFSSLKNLCRALGRASGGGGKNKDLRVTKATSSYLGKSRRLYNKILLEKDAFPVRDARDIASVAELERFLLLMEKHIDLIDRRLLQGEKIPHDEKMFSIFEQYTEWITKGKSRPNVELGKRVSITTDGHNLIVDYEIMESKTDSEIVEELSKRVSDRYDIENWSFDKGYWSKENKACLDKVVDGLVVMPKKGRKNKEEKERESSRKFKRLRNRHSAVESNINELEHRGLDRCPDRGYPHFKRYVGMGVIAYNIHKIGTEILKQEAVERKKRERKKRERKKNSLRQVQRKTAA